MAGLTNLTSLSLRLNKITDISALLWLTKLTVLDVLANPLSTTSVNDDIPALELRGVAVDFDRLFESDFDVELVFLDDFSERDRNILQYAARRWRAVITGDLPDYVFTEGWSGKCGGQSVEILSGERIDDLRIYMTTFEGGTAAGWGGPTIVRDETHLPVVGCMGFDLSANLFITGLHEIGHVLGFGTIWDDLGFFQNPPDGDKHFNGPLAISAFDEAGGRNYSGAKVPLADAAHWSGDAFGRGELMLPWGGGALSAITVQSLADLGYGVDVTQADPFTLQGAAGKAVAKLAAAPLPVNRFGVHVGPVDFSARYGVRPDGPGRLLGVVSSDTADDHWDVHPRSDRRMGNFSRDFGRGINRLSDRHDLADAAEPQTWCGAGLRADPIHVVDQQGRIVRTIGER